MAKRDSEAAIPDDLKFYREDAMRSVRERLEADVLAWPGVTRKGMMGCLVYFRGTKFFAFLVTGGLVITKLPDADRATLSERKGAKPFEMSGRTTSKWVQLPVTAPEDVARLLPHVRKSYGACR